MQKIQQQQIKIFKVVIIGDSGVGKTNLLTTFCEGRFKQNYVPTIGVDFKIKQLNIDQDLIKLQIWDTAGQERFRTIAQTYYRGAAGIILMYAIDSAQSFSNISNWLKQIQSHANQDVCKMLIGTKNDLQNDRQVTLEEGKALAIKHGLQFEEVSAKNGLNVDKMFMTMAKMIKIERQSSNADLFKNNDWIKLQKSKHEENKKCSC